MNVTEKTLNEIKAKVDIVELISKFVEIKQSVDTDNSTIHRGLCPFHEEETPSFVVFPATETYYCFGCNAGKKGTDLTLKDGTVIIDAGSDAIGFVMNYFSTGFREACIYLAEEHGIELESESPHIQKKKEETTNVNKAFWRNLKKNTGAMQYLENRGLTQDSINAFRLGLTPENHPNTSIANRIVFAMMDHKGNDLTKVSTLGFAYRTMGHDKPKYKNDPDNEIFSKGHHLYGLNLAIPEIRRAKCAIVVEGYFSVILCHQKGIKNVVATMGTAFTSSQMDLLKQYTNKVIFWYDPDEPGQTAIKKTIPLLLQKGFEVSVVDRQITEYLDPGDYVLQFENDSLNTKEFVRKISSPALNVYLDKVFKAYDEIKTQAQMVALSELHTFIDSMPESHQKDVYMSLIKRRLDL